MNRLKLDFALSYTDERINFIKKYVTEQQFQQRPLTEEECEMIANYVLWGKNRQTGQNAQQDGLVELPSRNGDWSSQQNIESLEELSENPMFNEATVRPITSIPYKVRKEAFSREGALRKAPPSLRDNLIDLFRQIDTLEYKIGLWDLAHNKRTKPLRAELTKQFTEEDTRAAQSEIIHWNQFKYLKKRHELIELRRSQYTLRDFFAPTITQKGIHPVQEEITPPIFDSEIEVLPLGTFNKTQIAQLVFRPFDQCAPAFYSDSEIEQLTKFYWKKKKFSAGANNVWFDFSNTDHLYKLVDNWQILCLSADTDLSTRALLEAFKFYVEQSKLTDLQKELLDLKKQKVKNADIAITINKKYGKGYSDNYISTVYTQKILTGIAAAVNQHSDIIANLSFKEEFKQCLGCGKWIRRTPDYFTRKIRSNDGLSTRCKACEKIARDKKAQGAKKNE